MQSGSVCVCVQREYKCLLVCSWLGICVCARTRARAGFGNWEHYRVLLLYHTSYGGRTPLLIGVHLTVMVTS